MELACNSFTLLLYFVQFKIVGSVIVTFECSPYKKEPDSSVPGADE